MYRAVNRGGFPFARFSVCLHREVNRGGLPLLYEILLDSAASQLCTVLKIITRSAERGQPSLFFCKLGEPKCPQGSW